MCTIGNFTKLSAEDVRSAIDIELHERHKSAKRKRIRPEFLDEDEKKTG